MSNDHSHDASAGDHNEISHVASVKTLVGTFGTLMVLTVLTVAATKVDFGGNANLLLAMVIATVKATLVCLYFMHLRYDKLFHSVILGSALLLATLFVTFSLMDSYQYQDDVAWEHDDLSPAPY